MTRTDAVLDVLKWLAQQERPNWNARGVDEIVIKLRWDAGEPRPRASSSVEKHRGKIEHGGACS